MHAARNIYFNRSGNCREKRSYMRTLVYGSEFDLMNVYLYGDYVDPNTLSVLPSSNSPLTYLPPVLHIPLFHGPLGFPIATKWLL